MSLILQANGAGAWKNVAHLERAQIEDVAAHAASLAKALGASPKWRIVEPQGGYPVEVMDDAQIRQAKLPPQSPSQMVADCKATVLRLGLGLCALPEVEYLQELEKLYTEGFRAGVIAAESHRPA